MKNLLFFALLIFIFPKISNAQVSKTMPADADEFYNKSMPLLRPQVKKIVLQTAQNIKHSEINADSLSRVLSKNPVLKGMSNKDIAGITVLVMVQASKDADADLKQMVLEISRQNEKDNAMTNQNEVQNSKLQTIIDRKSGMAEEISYVMKKISRPERQDIINNLK
ncbi:MAG: hypothetical protein ABIY62_02165 [Ginsengibacter sp.]